MPTFVLIIYLVSAFLTALLYPIMKAHDGRKWHKDFYDEKLGVGEFINNKDILIGVIFGVVPVFNTIYLSLMLRDYSKEILGIWKK